METRKDILNELREVSPVLAAMEKVNVFTVPAGYFDRIADTMLLLVNEEQNSVLTGIQKQNAHVPEGYFESLADNILNKIKAQETSETYPVLNNISNVNVYTVPADYFNTLSDEVIAKIAQPQTKVISISRRTSWFKYAAAAVFAGTVMISVYKFMPSRGTSEDPAVTVGKQIAKEKTFDQELAKISDEDIIKYLQVNGTDVDAAVVANVVDENELPAKEDYLTDDKALDKYLDNIDLTDLKN